MEIKRKIQLGAAAVIANGLFALSTMVPTIALANPCATMYTVVQEPGCGSPELQCQLIAPAGCTVTSAQCVLVPPNNAFFVCHYGE